MLPYVLLPTDIIQVFAQNSDRCWWHDCACSVLDADFFFIQRDYFLETYNLA